MIFSIFLLYLCNKNKVSLSPGAIFILINLVTMLILAVHVSGLYIFEDFLGIPLVFHEQYEQSDISLFVLYSSIFSLIVYPYSSGKNYKYNAEIKVGEKFKDKRNICCFQSQQYSNYSLLLTQYFFVLFLYVFLFIYLYQVDIELIFYNESYLLINDPHALGVENKGAQLLHNASGFLGIIFSFLSGLFFMRKRYIEVVLYFPLAFLFFLLKLSLFSRWCPIILFSLLLPIVLFGKEKNNSIFRVGLYFFVFFFMFLLYASMITGRYGVGQGLIAFSDALMSVFGNLNQYIEFFFINVFGGAFVFLEAMQSDAVTYPLYYKLLSFSPLPSFLDGWDYWGKYFVMVNNFVPYNVLSELDKFGFQYFILYLIVVFFVFRACNKLFFSDKSLLPLIAAMPLYVYSLMFHFYFIRYSYKLLFVSFVLSLILGRILKSNNRDIC